SMLVFQMFTRLNLTIVLTSLEFWTERDKIPTVGGAQELLQRFLQWKNTHRVLRLQDITFLLVGCPAVTRAPVPTAVPRRDDAGDLLGGGGAAAGAEPGHRLRRRPPLPLRGGHLPHAEHRGVRLPAGRGRRPLPENRLFYPNGFSVAFRRSPGAKTFSSCSVRDFQRFLASGEGQCLWNRPTMDISYRAPVCGNKVVEPGEACDCGSPEQECKRDLCCTVGCKAKKGVECLSGPCCWKCRFLQKGTLCRSSPEDECELKEYCNGTSGQCTPNFWVMDGHPCNRRSAFCYRGVCQLADKQCQRVFGKGARNGPLACYEEINGRRDRMGHCGSNQSGYQSCAWKDLRCGKLICEYPSHKPFTREKAAVVYARVQNSLCVTLDYMKPPAQRDPMLVNDGTVCGDRMVSAP
uniref:ADA32 protein n=1 Tax=Nothoprocta perdicaria TaxID=30464 RepID=A0A8C6Z9T1_NOTPE